MRWKNFLLIAVVLCILPLQVFSQGFESEVFRAVSELSNSSRPIRIGIGAISLSDTGSVGSLSGFLKDQIKLATTKDTNRNKYFMVSDSEVDAFINSTNFGVTRSADPLGGGSGFGASIQGLIEGRFSQLGNDVEVFLTLTTISNNEQTTSRFVVPADELRRRGLSVLPPKEDEVIEVIEFEEKQEILEPWEGTDNKFNLQVWSNKADNIFYDKDLMFINLYSDRDCYFTVYHVDVYGNRKMIYPNQYDKNNFLPAESPRRINEKGAFKMGCPYGEEHILVFASDTPFENNPSNEVSRNITDITGDSRGITVVYLDEEEIITEPKEAVARYNYTILRDTSYESFSYQKPDDMMQFYNEMSAELDKLGGSISAPPRILFWNYEHAYFSYPGVEGSYGVSDDQVIINLQYTDNELSVGTTRGVKAPYTFSINKPSNMSQAVQSVRSGIEESGGIFSGNEQQGNFRAKGIVGSYNVAASVNVSITDKPFVIPNSLIEKEVTSYFSGK
jgi:hypothetical protein